MEEYKKKTSTGDDVFSRVHNVSSAPRPTAVLLGWLGSTHKNVAKYAAIYERMGYNTVRLVAPISIVFSLRQRTTSYFLLSLLRIIAADERLFSGGIVFMMFSNGGAILAPHLTRFFAGVSHYVHADDELVVKTIKDSISAIVFDSAPCYLHNRSGANAIITGMNVPSGLLSWMVIFIFTCLAVMHKILVMDLPKFFWEGLKNGDYLCPEQYIYSTKDVLLDAPMLDDLIEYRRREGRDLQVFRVDDAAHVKIMIKHTEKYIETLHSVNRWGVNRWRKRTGLPDWDIDETYVNISNE